MVSYVKKSIPTDCRIYAKVRALNNILVILHLVSATFFIQFLISSKLSGYETNKIFYDFFRNLFMLIVDTFLLHWLKMMHQVIKNI